MISSAFFTTVLLFSAIHPLFIVTPVLPLNFGEIFLAYFIEREVPTSIAFLEFVRSPRHRGGNFHVSDIWTRPLNGARFSTNQSAMNGFAARCPKHRSALCRDAGAVGQTQGTSKEPPKRLYSTAVDVLLRTRFVVVGTGGVARGVLHFCTCRTWT